jgi:hypothetical protein
MAEKTKFERWLGSLTPEQRVAFDASVEFGDQEYIGEVQRKLPPELRFGGEFGLPSALGYGKGTNEDRAQIRNYTTRGQGLPSILGQFSKSPRGLGYTEAEAIERGYDPEKPSKLEKSKLIQFMSTPPDQDMSGGKGVSVFMPVGDNEAERAFASKEGYMSEGNRYSYPTTVAHELTHKGFDSPAFLDFLEETGRNEGRPLSDRQEHRLIDKSPYEVDNRMVQDDYRKLLGNFREWLTPEKQEKYGVRLPVPAAEPVDPSMLDRLIDFIQGK